MRRWSTRLRHHHRIRKPLKNRHERHLCGDEVILFIFREEKRKKNMWAGWRAKIDHHITASPHPLPTLGLWGSLARRAKCRSEPCLRHSARGCRKSMGVFSRQDLTARPSLTADLLFGIKPS
jgi:hypothetical protein